MTIGDKAWWDAVKKVPRLTDEEIRFHMNALWERMLAENWYAKPEPKGKIMASEMVERVARALYDHAAMARNWKDRHPWVEENEDGERVKRAWRVKARAAIEAMREPTAAMADEGDHHCSASDVRHVWRAMIDQTLK